MAGSDSGMQSWWLIGYQRGGSLIFLNNPVLSFSNEEKDIFPMRKKNKDPREKQTRETSPWIHTMVAMTLYKLFSLVNDHGNC